MPGTYFWYCGYCHHGPMVMEHNPCCAVCGRRQDASATFEDASFYPVSNPSSYPIFNPSSGSSQQVSGSQPPLQEASSATSVIESFEDILEASPRTVDSQRPTSTIGLQSIENLRAHEGDPTLGTLDFWACHVCTEGPYTTTHAICTACTHQLCQLCMWTTTEVLDHFVRENAKTTENEMLIRERPQKAFLHSPKAYFKNLTTLKAGTYSHSLLTRSIASKRSGLPLPFPDNHLKHRNGWQDSFTEGELHDIHVDAITNILAQPIMGQEAVQRRLERRIVECRNALFDTCRCLQSLEETDFLVDCVSILVLDAQRRSTVKMIPLKPRMIYDLAQVFHKSLGYLEARHTSLTRPLAVEVILGTITIACNRIMQVLGLSLHSQFTSESSSGTSLMALDHLTFWRNTVRVLDLAVMSYIGAHIDDTLKLSLDEYHALQAQDDDFGSRWLLGIQFQSRRLRCLTDALNDSEVWVFNLEGTISSADASYLATTIRTLADIWGPAWRASEDRETASFYSFSGGSIVPWSPDFGQHPVLNLGERLAHWVPYSLLGYASAPGDRDPWRRQSSSLSECDMNPQNPNVSELDSSEQAITIQRHDRTTSDTDMPISLPDHSDGSETDSLDSESTESEPEEAETHDNSSKTAVYQFAQEHPFEIDDLLLIGAQFSPKLRNHRCRCSVSEYMHRLKEMQRLYPLETSKLFYHIDSKLFNMTIGYNGCNLGAGIALKKQDGRMWKQVLLEIWENQPNARHPMTLDHFWGVLISKCNYNCRRTRLIELLGTDSMHQILKPFSWSNDEMRKAFLEATTSKNPFAVNELWDRRPEWQEELGKVLLTCLRALCQTGYDSSREELYALWMSSKSMRPKRVVLKPSEHSWVRLLQDTENACGLAVIVKECLGITHPSGRHQRCQRQHNAPSRLETSLVINTQIAPHDDLVKLSRKRELDVEQWRTADRNWEYYWDVSKVEDGATFWVVPRSRLKLCTILSATHLLLDYDTIKRDKFLKKIGAPVGERLGHWEYTEDEEHPLVRPIPVHVQATR